MESRRPRVARGGEKGGDGEREDWSIEGRRGR